jgi:hypothetical protein
MSSYDSFLVTNQDDSVLLIVKHSKIILYSLIEQKKILELSARERILSSIFLPNSPYLIGSIGFEGLIVLNIVTGEYFKIKTDDNVDRLLYLESSGEVLGFKNYEYKYVIWKADNIIEAYRKIKATN